MRQTQLQKIAEDYGKIARKLREVGGKLRCCSQASRSHHTQHFCTGDTQGTNTHARLPWSLVLRWVSLTPDQPSSLTFRNLKEVSKPIHTRARARARTCAPVHLRTKDILRTCGHGTPAHTRTHHTFFPLSAFALSAFPPLSAPLAPSRSTTCIVHARHEGKGSETQRSGLINGPRGSEHWREGGGCGGLIQRMCLRSMGPCARKGSWVWAGEWGTGTG